MIVLISSIFPFVSSRGGHSGEPDQQTTSRFHYAVDPGIKYMNESWTYWLSVDIDTVSGKVKGVWLAD